MARLILLALLLPTLLQAQNPHFVLSSNGLKLRAAPDQNSTALAVAPFGARVQVLTRDTNPQYGFVQYDPPARRDTIGVLYPERPNWYPAGHTGYWWQVRYQGKTGYMFSGFLADSLLLGWKSDYHPKPELNDQFRLRTTGGNAGATNHPEFDPDWRWYGLYPEAEGRFTLKKIQPRYAVEDMTNEKGEYDYYSRQLVLLTDPPSEPVYIFGTRKPWKTRDGIDGFCAECFVMEQGPKTPQEVTAALKKYRIEVSHPGEGRAVEKWYLLGPNGERQQVYPSEFSKTVGDDPIQLAWAGDLDGDGRPDFIFQSTGAQGYAVLYLSSLARKGEVARPAAVLWTWYTC